MNISITKKFKFEAAHLLPHHDGKCKNLHGHSYVLEVSLSGELHANGPKEGMVMDFSEVTSIVNQEVITPWDHQFLNDLLPFVTTAENLAVEIFNRLSKQLPVTKVKLWETATCFVEVEK